MPVLKENVGTFLLESETVTIVKNWGIKKISLLLVSGNVTITGTLSLGDRPADPITVSAGNPLNLSFDYAIDGLEINADSGSAILITGK